MNRRLPLTRGLLLANSFAVTILVTACGGGGNSSPQAAKPVAPATNQLYTETDETANKVVHMSRAADGSLTLVDVTPTGGAGTNGVGLAATTTVAGGDSLTSQHSVVVSTNGQVLFAVNAGDNSISTFSINPTTGSLTLLKTNNTDGTFPTSLAYSNGYLYASFEAGSNQLQAFQVNADGSLTVVGEYAIPIIGTNRDVPTQVAIAPNGSYLVVNAGTASNEIVSYPINGNGTLGSAVQNTTGITSPFAGAFASNGIYLSTDITDKALGAYTFNAGVLTAVAPVVSSGITAPCWLSVTPDGSFAFVGNGAGPISAYSVSGTGALTLLNATAASDSTTVAADSWISGDGKFLYTAYLAEGVVRAYSIGSNGSLTQVGTPVAIPTTSGVSMQGLVGL